MTIHLIRGLEGTGKTTLCSVLNARGYVAIDTDFFPGLTQWIDPVTQEPAETVPDYLDENWIASHRFVWNPDRMRELFRTYEGRQAFLCGSASNLADFYGSLGLRFYLWATDSTITRRLQERNPSLWRHGASEISRRLMANRSARLEAIMGGDIVIYAELPAEEVATDIVAYAVAASNSVGHLRLGTQG